MNWRDFFVILIIKFLLLNPKHFLHKARARIPSALYVFILLSLAGERLFFSPINFLNKGKNGKKKSGLAVLWEGKRREEEERRAWNFVTHRTWNFVASITVDLGSVGRSKSSINFKKLRTPVFLQWTTSGVSLSADISIQIAIASRDSFLRYICYCIGK